MASNYKVPSIRLAVTLLEDADFWGLMDRGPKGREALLMFILLLTLAKKLKNGGEFNIPIATAARMIGYSTKEASDAIELIESVCSENGNASWIGCSGGKITLRNFRTWNTGWGGKRGANSDQDDTQDDYQDAGQDENQDAPNLGGQEGSHPDSVSLSSSDTGAGPIRQRLLNNSPGPVKSMSPRKSGFLSDRSAGSGRATPPNGSPKAQSGDQRFAQVFVMELAEAFQLGDPTAASRQGKSFYAIARRLVARPDRKDIAAKLVRLARDKRADGTLQRPIAAWQSEVNRMYPKTE